MPSFLDYLVGGVRLNVICAVDFTGSNGDPTDPTSLHYHRINGMNEYQQAIHGVCEVMLHYD